MDWDKDLKEMITEDDKVKSSSNPNSWRCKLGFHKWPKWVRHTVKTQNKGEVIGEYTAQIRHCQRCNMAELREYV